MCADTHDSIMYFSSRIVSTHKIQWFYTHNHQICEKNEVV